MLFDKRKTLKGRKRNRQDMEAPVNGNPAGTNEAAGMARLSVLSNSILIAMKVVAGVLMGSVSVISEAMHSGVDLLAAIIANVSIRKSRMPPDEMHKFGHGKFENISGTIEAVLILAVALFIIYEASMKILHGAAVEYLWAGLAVMGISAVVNFFVSRKLMSVSKRTDSIALEADAYHLSVDVYTSVGVAVGLALIQITGIHVLDPVVAIVIAVIILKGAVDLTKRSALGLVDAKLPDEEEAIIKSIISEHYSEFLEYHALRSRKSGPERFVDLHLVLPKGRHVSDAHDLCDHLERDIKARISNINLLIHVEPCDENCEACKRIDICFTEDE